MSNSDQLIAVDVAADQATETFVIDHAFNLIKRGVGPFSLELVPGLYKFKFRKGSALQEIHREIGRASASLKIVAPQLEFSSSVPLAALSAAQQKEARDLSGAPPRGVGAGHGSSLFLFVREEPNSGARSLDAVASLSLRTLGGAPLANLAQDGQCSREHGTTGLLVELDPGAYLLHTECEGNAIQQVVVTSPGWMTQLFLLVGARRAGEPEKMQPVLPAVRLEETSAFMSRGPFDSSDQLLLYSEVARIALATQRVAIPRKLMQVLIGDKFESPMLGIYAAHALRASIERQRISGDSTRADEDQGLLGSVIDRLVRLIPEHPDVVALTSPEQARSIASPPMLRSSWSQVVAATINNQWRLEPQSLAARIPSSLMTATPWLIWSKNDLLPARAARQPVNLDDLQWRVDELARREASLRTRKLSESESSVYHFLERRTRVRRRHSTAVKGRPDESWLARAFGTSLFDIQQSIRSLIHKLADYPTIASKTIRGSAELVFVSDILPGFVEISEPVTYGTRLRQLLRALYELRKDGVERVGTGFVGPLERLETLHSVNWCVIDGRIHDNGRIDNEQLLLVATFDQPWEPYIRGIVDQAGPLLDLIFSHCVGFEGHSSRYGYDKFAAFVRAHQRETHYFAGGNPECTVNDVRYFQKLQASRGAASPDSILQSAVGALDPDVPDSNELDRLLRLLGELYKTRRLYPEVLEGATRRIDPISDRDYYDTAAGLLLKGFVPTDPARRLQTLQSVQELVLSLGSNHRNLGAYYGEQLKRLEQQKPKRATFSSLRGKPQPAVLMRNAEKTHGCLLLLRFAETAPEAALTQARAVLEERERAGVSWTVSFTYGGLEKLVSAQDLDWLPQEFRLGMEARAGLLGDIGQNHPSAWRRPKLNAGASQDTELRQEGEVDLATVDVAIQLSGNSEPRPGDHRWNDQHPFWPIFKQLATIDGVQVLHVQPLRRYAERKQADGVFKEHFGFLDGSSQPDPLQEPADPRFATPLGEFLLGYPDAHGDQADCPLLFEDGSFLVVRKLRQNVKDFEAFLEETTQSCGIGKDELRGYLMGRDTKGIPLGVNAELGNEFNYDGDMQGHRCPLQAHARRANPRLPLTCSAHQKPLVTPRILRRGFPYGPEQRTEREDEQGLLFLAYNARIAEQFEVLQRWINGANITGLSSDQNDALVGCADPKGVRRFTFKHAEKVLSVELPRERPFVTLEWGMYLFTPSLPALTELAEGRVQRGLIQARRADGDAQVGEELIRRLLAIESPGVSNDGQDMGKAKGEARECAQIAWKKVLEDGDERTEEQAASIWAAIREGTGVLKTPYGILVGGAEPARAVLSDESLYSVREYWARMMESFGPLHLGMDRTVTPEVVCPNGRDADYVAASQAGKIDYRYNAVINAELSAIQRESAFKEARARARATLSKARTKAGNTDQAMMDVSLLAEDVIGQLSALWFGFPDPAAPGTCSPPLLIQGKPEPLGDPNAAYCPYDFTVASQHIFRPNPDSSAIRASQLRGKVAQAATQAFLREAQAAPKHDFLKCLFEKFPNDMDAVRQALIGAVDGFVAATYGSFVSVIDRWIEEGTLTTMQRQYGPLLREDPSRVVDAPSDFVDEIHATMKRRPVPPCVYRTVLASTELGDVHVQPGDRVVVYLGSAAHLQRDDELLFGGKYEKKKGAQDSVHACPGRELALGVLCGLFAAVFERANLRRESRLSLSFHP